MLKRRAIILASFLAIIALVVYRLMNPSPPDLSNDGYVTAEFSFRELPDLPAFGTETSDPQVILALTKAIASGRSDTNCRCISLATVTLRRPNRGKTAFALMPSHRDDDCQILMESGRFLVDRNEFLAAIAPLGISADRLIGKAN